MNSSNIYEKHDESRTQYGNYIGFQLILVMLTYVAPCSGRYTNYHNFKNHKN